MINQYWVSFGLAAEACLLMCAAFYLLPFAVRRFGQLLRTVRNTPFRATLGLIAVSILVVYGGKVTTKQGGLE